MGGHPPKPTTPSFSRNTPTSTNAPPPLHPKSRRARNSGLFPKQTRALVARQPHPFPRPARLWPGASRTASRPPPAPSQPPSLPAPPLGQRSTRLSHRLLQVHSGAGGADSAAGPVTRAASAASGSGRKSPPGRNPDPGFELPARAAPGRLGQLQAEAPLTLHHPPRQHPCSSPSN